MLMMLMMLMMMMMMNDDYDVVVDHRMKDSEPKTFLSQDMCTSLHLAVFLHRNVLLEQRSQLK